MTLTSLNRWKASALHLALSAAIAVIAVAAMPQESAAIRAFVAASGRAEDTIGFLPMKARDRDMAVVVDKKTGDVVGILPVQPW